MWCEQHTIEQYPIDLSVEITFTLPTRDCGTDILQYSCIEWPVRYIYKICSTCALNNTKKIASWKSIQKIFNTDIIQYIADASQMHMFGLNLDEKITWTAHLKKLKDKKKILNIIKHFQACNGEPTIIPW